jgi:F-type H+-transporting ATPase subunit delta
MTNPRLATRYAKSLIDLAIEQNQLDATYNDMVTLQTICKGNKDFVQLLKSPIVKPNTKQKIVSAVTEGKVGVLVNAFNNLIIAKGREANLPEVVNTFIQQYKDYKGIKSVKLTTAFAIGDDTKNDIVNKMKMDGNNVEIETIVDENIIGGFVLQTGNNLIDASIAFDLKAIQKQFMNNDFIYKIK